MDEEYEAIITEINTLLRCNERGRERTKTAIEVASKRKYINSEILRGVLSEAFPAFFTYFANMLEITTAELNHKLKTTQGFETKTFLKLALRYYILQY